MTTPEMIALISAILSPAIFGAWLTWYLKMKERKIVKQEENESTKVQDAAKLRSELWEQYEKERNRNNAFQETNMTLSRQYGELLTKTGTIEGSLKAKQEQVDELLARYATAMQKAEEADYRREKDREKFEVRIDVLEKEAEEAGAREDTLGHRIIELEHDIARMTRGGPSRRSDKKGETVG